MEIKKIKVTLYFPAGSINTPITYHLIKDYDLELNILHADINLNKVGKLTLDISGTDKNIEAGLKYAQDQGIEYKLFSKSIIWQEDNCVHCGACTAVCPSGALQMAEHKMREPLMFRKLTPYQKQRYKLASAIILDRFLHDKWSDAHACLLSVFIYCYEIEGKTRLKFSEEIRLNGFVGSYNYTLLSPLVRSRMINQEYGSGYYGLTKKARDLADKVLALLKKVDEA